MTIHSLDARKECSLRFITHTNLLIILILHIMITSVTCNTWVIERRYTGDIIRNIPANFKCGESVQDWYINKTTGLCECMRNTPTFVVYGDGSFGCVRSQSACQDCTQVMNKNYPVQEFTGEIKVDKTPANCFSGENVLTEPITFMYFRQFEWIAEKTFITKIEDYHALIKLPLSTPAGHLKGHFIKLEMECEGKIERLFIKLEGVMTITDPLAVNSKITPKPPITNGTSTTTTTTKSPTTLQHNVNSTVTNTNRNANTNDSKTQSPVYTLQPPTNETNTQIITTESVIEETPHTTHSTTIQPNNSPRLPTIKNTTTVITPKNPYAKATPIPNILPSEANATESPKTTRRRTRTTPPRPNKPTTPSTPNWLIKTKINATKSTLRNTKTKEPIKPTTKSPNIKRTKTLHINQTKPIIKTDKINDILNTTKSTVTKTPTTTTTLKTFTTTQKEHSTNHTVDKTTESTPPTIHATSTIQKTSLTTNKKLITTTTTTASQKTRPSTDSKTNPKTQKTTPKTHKTSTKTTSKTSTPLPKSSTKTKTNSNTSNHTNRTAITTTFTTTTTPIQNTQTIETTVRETSLANAGASNDELVLQVAVPLAIMLCVTLGVIVLLLKWRNNEKKYIPPSSTSKTETGSTVGGNFYEYASTKELQPSSNYHSNGHSELKHVASDKKPVLPERNSPTQDTYTSLELSATPINLYHPLSLESPSEEKAPSIQPPPAVRDPLYFETEPIYSETLTPQIKRRQEPLYHETVPDPPPGGNLTPPLQNETPPPIPTSRRPSAIFYPPGTVFINEGMKADSNV